jgi:hypothetical protein
MEPGGTPLALYGAQEAHPVTRLIHSILFILLVAHPLLAQDAAEPRFFIDRIEVRNAHRVSPGVIVSESRLREGHEYSESELRDASTRLSRLPFLLSAEFSLEKGSERGHHVLVLTVNETKPFFFSLDIRPIFTNDAYTRVDYSDRSTGTDSEGVVGMRWFVGRRGAVHAGVYARDFQHDFADDYLALAVGYTQYDLFGSRAFATLNLKRAVTSFDSAGIAPQLVVGIPVAPNQTVTLSIDDTDFGSELRRIGATDDVRVSAGQRVVSAAWTYNTTNHPFLPTRGTLLQVRPMMAWLDRTSYEYYVFDGGYYIDSVTTHSRAVIGEISGSRYWELSEHNSVSAGFEAGAADFNVRSNCTDCVGDNDRQYAIVHGGFSHSLWDRNRSKDGDSRIEVSVRLGKSLTDLGDPYRYDRNDQTEQISASWVRRSSWGTLRLGAGYAR